MEKKKYEPWEIHKAIEKVYPGGVPELAQISGQSKSGLYEKCIRQTPKFLSWLRHDMGVEIIKLDVPKTEKRIFQRVKKMNGGTNNVGEKIKIDASDSNIKGTVDMLMALVKRHEEDIKELKEKLKGAEG